MTKTIEEVELLFQEKVKMIEENTYAKDLELYFVMQVGPRDAKTIVNQMKAFFISGYYEGVKEKYNNGKAY